MATKRTPINRHHRRQITPAAIELFRQMKTAGTRAAWWAAHNQLHRELGCKPWQWPCVADPAWNDPEAHPDALALWAELEAASDQAPL